MNGITRSKSTIGSYLSPGGAKTLVIDRSERDSSILTPIVSAHCGGLGCTAEAPVAIGSAVYVSMVDRAEKVTYTARAVQEWAQAHAEVCRATPVPGNHPADADLPLCGTAHPEDLTRTCQLTTGHTWKHAAHTGGSYGYRVEWDVPAEVCN